MINYPVKGAAGLGHHFSCYQFLSDWKGHLGWGYGRPSKAQVLVHGSGVSWDINEDRKGRCHFLRHVNSKCSMVFSSVVDFLHTTSALNEQFQFENRFLGGNKFRKHWVWVKPSNKRFAIIIIIFIILLLVFWVCVHVCVHASVADYLESADLASKSWPGIFLLPPQPWVYMRALLHWTFCVGARDWTQDLMRAFSPLSRLIRHQKRLLKPETEVMWDSRSIQTLWDLFLARTCIACPVIEKSCANSLWVTEVSSCWWL